MMKATMETTGFEDYLAAIADAEGNIDTSAEKALNQGLDVLHRGLLQRVPVGKGALKKRIYRTIIMRDDNKVYGYVGWRLGAKHEFLYGVFVEYGRPGVAARPWYRATMRNDRRKMLAAMESSLKSDGMLP